MLKYKCMFTRSNHAILIPRSRSFVLLRSLLLIVLFGPCLKAIAADQQFGIGANKFDLAMQYLGVASGGDGSPPYMRIASAMARKALDDALDSGIGFVRVAVTGFAPSAHGTRSDLRLWQESPAAYWLRMDQLMNDLDARGIQLVPVLMWNVRQFPAMSRETVGDLVRDGNSTSWTLLARYVREFVLRYRERKTILFYELTNELNLLVDLDNIVRCRRDQRKRSCKIWSNISTNDMIAFTRRFSALVKRLDPSRAVSSGFSVPRAAAEHLRQNPTWIPGKDSWKRDHQAQFKKNLQDIHAPLDIISVHLYDNPKNRRFGSTDASDLLKEAKEAADEVGKPLFVGEFGDSSPAQAGPDSFVVRMLEKLSELRVPYAAVWVWEFYQRKTYLTHDNPHTAFSLEPGQTDFLIDRISNAARGRPKPPMARSGSDQSPPRVVLTWPLPCAVLDANQKLFAVASDDRGRVARLEFGLDGKAVFVDSEPPYAGRVETDELTAGPHTLNATAFDGAGNRETWSTPVLVRPLPKAKAACLQGVPVDK